MTNTNYFVSLVFKSRIGPIKFALSLMLFMLYQCRDPFHFRLVNYRMLYLRVGERLKNLLQSKCLETKLLKFQKPSTLLLKFI